MHEDDLRDKINWLRARADEVLAVAENMKYRNARQPLVRVAQASQEAAQQLEELLKLPGDAC